MDPELNAPAAAPQQATPQVPDAGQEPDADEGDTGPLEKIDVQPAEGGASVITHHPKVSERVKAMDHEKTKPRVHVAKNHEEMVKHMDKHGKRLQP